MDSDRRIGRARAAAHHHNAGPASKTTIGNSHETRARFMPTSDHIEQGKVIQRVKHTQVTFTGHQEHTVHAVFDQVGEQRVR